MRSFPIAVLATALGLSALPVSPSTAQDRPTLTVYTYDSFTAEWGPGPQIEPAFEAECACDLRFIALADGVAILSRLKMEGGAAEGDLVLGLDQNLIPEAMATGFFAPSQIALDGLELPVAWTDSVFVPFDWSHFAFVYDTDLLPEPPRSLRALVYDSDVEIAIQDPRTSTPGLGLLIWMRAVFGDDAGKAWAALKPRIVTVTPGWSESYGLFREGEVPMVLSYTTSPPVHRLYDEDDTVEAAVFEEGHPIQIEVAGMLASSRQPELARSFLAFMLSPAFQDVLPTTQFMYPIRMPEGGLPEAYEAAPRDVATVEVDPVLIAEHRQAWIDEWLSALSP